MDKCHPECEHHSIKCHLIACEEASLRFDEVDESIDQHNDSTLLLAAADHSIK